MSDTFSNQNLGLLEDSCWRFCLSFQLTRFDDIKSSHRRAKASVFLSVVWSEMAEIGVNITEHTVLTD